MAFKININANIKREILNKIIERRLKLIRENIRVVMRNKALPHLIDLVMKGYDELTDRAAMGPDDPTNPLKIGGLNFSHLVFPWTTKI